MSSPTGIVGGLSAIALFASTVAAPAAPLIDRSYFEEKVSANCNGYYCRLDFSQIISRVLLEQVSCYITTTAPLRIAALGATATAGGLTSRSFSLAIPNYIASNGTYFYTLRDTIKYLVPKKQFVLMSIETIQASSTYASCSIVGTYAYPE